MRTTSYDHTLKMHCVRRIGYMFDLEDDTHVQILMSNDTMYVARVLQRWDEGTDLRQELYLARKQVYPNCELLGTHADARTKAFMNCPEANSVAWKMFWDLCVVPAYDGKDSGWLEESFGQHAKKWLFEEQKLRERAAKEVLES